MLRVRAALVRKSPEAKWNKGRPADLTGGWPCILRGLIVGKLRCLSG